MESLIQDPKEFTKVLRKNKLLDASLYCLISDAIDEEICQKEYDALLDSSVPLKGPWLNYIDGQEQSHDS